jgi:nitrite reductase/ring-hydroxylating ferredoxin subunit/uncharacterized membrane protein
MRDPSSGPDPMPMPIPIPTGDSTDSALPAQPSEPTGAPTPKQPFVERLSDALQKLIGALIGANRKPPRRFKSLLNGTWLGHPLHPVLTDIPIAAWLIAALFDILWLVAPAANTWAARGAEALVLVGFAAALGSVVTGLADWSDTYGRERTTGFLHGLLMSTATIVYAVSLGLRFTTSSGASLAGAIAGFAGLVIVLYAAYLGGDLVFKLGTGVNHTAWEAAGEHFEPVMAFADVAENRLYRVMAAGVPVVLLREHDRIYAISATCTHAGGPLDEGELQSGGIVQCPWHSSRFRVRDGRALTGPATADAPRYDVRVRDGQVEIKRRDGH